MPTDHIMFVALSSCWTYAGLWSPVAEILKSLVVNLSKISAENEIPH